MNSQPHFTQINIQQEMQQRIACMASELDALRQTGELRIEISATDLFHLEALGYVVDFTTGMIVTNLGGWTTVLVTSTGVTPR